MYTCTGVLGTMVPCLPAMPPAAQKMSLRPSNLNLESGKLTFGRAIDTDESKECSRFGDEQKEPKFVFKSLVTDPKFFDCTLVFGPDEDDLDLHGGLLAAMSKPFRVLTPIKEHGFALTAFDIGTILTLTAPFDLLHQFIYPKIVKKLGVILTTQFYIIIFGLTCIALPFTGLANGLHKYGAIAMLASVMAILIPARI
eukprot:300225_1